MLLRGLSSVIQHYLCSVPDHAFIWPVPRSRASRLGGVSKVRCKNAEKVSNQTRTVKIHKQKLTFSVAYACSASAVFQIICSYDLYAQDFQCAVNESYLSGTDIYGRDLGIKSEDGQQYFQLLYYDFVFGTIVITPLYLRNFDSAIYLLRCLAFQGACNGKMLSVSVIQI